MNNKTKTILLVILCVIIVASLGLSAWKILSAGSSDKPNPNATIIAAPEQSDFEPHPEWSGNKPQVSYHDYGENLAAGKAATANAQLDGYFSYEVTDSDLTTYWEAPSGAYPNEVTIDLGAVTEIGSAQILLNPDPIWGSRVQEIEVQVSTDGESYATVFPKTALTFDTADTDSAYIPFTEAISGQYVKFLFHSNTGAAGGQAAEIEIYAP
jgi:hypothetical protein